MSKKAPGPVYYGDYLQLNKILGAQQLESAQYGKAAHDEMLFIIIHQTYELWFKQIIFEVDSILSLFNQSIVPEKVLGTIYHRLQRIIEIQKVLIDQINILETMTPLDFLDFRDYLVPASGFQSLQFRIFEIKLGFPLSNRPNIKENFFLDRLNTEDRESLLKVDQEPGLLQLMEKWLERMPFLTFKNFNFWQEYKKTIDLMLANDQDIIQNNATLNEKTKNFQIQELNITRENFESLLSVEKHQKLIEAGERRLSQKATLAALFIHLYRDEPILHLPFKILSSLLDLDELLATWRYRHAMMAHRMLGTKIGTGGSSGHHYLRQTVDKGRVFIDFYNLSTFFIPRSMRPELPMDLKKELGYFFKEN